MIVYLDQNMWIELARIYHGKDESPGATSFLKEIEASIKCGYSYPLSALHYLEFSRISNSGPRKRLGEVMWKCSRGKNLISAREIVEREIEISLAQFFPTLKPRKINLVEVGMNHAFDKELRDLPPWMNEAIDKAMLTGNEELNVDPISFDSKTHRLRFLSHLEALNETKKQLDKKKWENWLYAMAITDILEPLKKVMLSKGLGKDKFESLSVTQLNSFVDAMPTRKLDVHLHRQVLKNSNYKPKETDLEDWAGLGVAACYCDIVVCEKHFADMLRRDKFKTKARIVTNLYEIFTTIR